MPYRINAMRRRIPTAEASISPEQITTLISGDWEYGALIPRGPEYAGPPFRNLQEAKRCWQRNWRLILKIHRWGWLPGDCEPTMEFSCSNWLRNGTSCWAEKEFGLPRGGERFLARLEEANPHKAGVA
jgi:hypothetical protein